MRDAGDVEMPPGHIERSLQALEDAVTEVAVSGAVPVVLGGDHSIAYADARGVANHHGQGRVSMIHFDAHADTGDTEFGSLWGHGQPMRRLIESGALRGDRFLQVGLRGYWPGPGDAGLDGGAAHALVRDDRDRRRAGSTPCSTRPATSRSTTATRCSSRSTSTSATPATPRAPGRPSPAA